MRIFFRLITFISFIAIGTLFSFLGNDVPRFHGGTALGPAFDSGFYKGRIVGGVVVIPIGALIVILIHKAYTKKPGISLKWFVIATIVLCIVQMPKIARTIDRLPQGSGKLSPRNQSNLDGAGRSPS